MSSRSLSKQQKDKLVQFVSITGADQRMALECLQLGGWQVGMTVVCRWLRVCGVGGWVGWPRKRGTRQGLELQTRQASTPSPLP